MNLQPDAFSENSQVWPSRSVRLQQTAHRLLLVDPDEQWRKTYQAELARLAERHRVYWEIESVSSAREAQDLLNRLEVDCILSEYQLPDQDGLTFMSQSVLAFEPCPAFIICTDHGSETVAVQALKLGAADYLVKGDLTSESLFQVLTWTVADHQNQHEIRRQRQLLRSKNEELREQKAQLEAALATIASDHQHKSRELEEARNLQMAMLPQEQPDLPQVRVQAYMHTAYEVGGDYYDFLELGQDHWLIAIGDATGHGFRSGIVVATVKSYFHLMGSQVAPADLLLRISEGIRALTLRHMYMGICLIELKGRQVAVYATGMPPLFHYQAQTSRVHTIRKPGMYLGSSLPVNQEPTFFTLQPGDLLMAMTDGLPELIDRHHHEKGYAVIRETLNQNHDQDARRILYHFIGLSKKWVEEQEVKDDLTLMLLQGK